MDYFAIIDAGSNTFRLHISKIKENGELELICKEKRMIRLSHGMGAEKIIQEDAINQALEALLQFKEKLATFPPIPVKVIGTAAIRMAVNKEEFLMRIKQETGFEMEVISGEQEATFDFISVKQSLSMESGLIIDTGGASCELILVEQGEIQHLISLPVGAVTLTEQFFKNDERTSQHYFRAFVYMEEKLRELDWFTKAMNSPIYTVGGSNRSIAKIFRNAKGIKKDLTALHGFQMTKQQVYETFAYILAKDTEERKNIKGLSKERADIIIGGLLPLIVVMSLLNSPDLIVSEYGLREGVLFTELNK